MEGSDDRDLAAELAELKARYLSMVELAPDGLVVFDLDLGRPVEVNPAACRIFEREREEILRMSLRELSPARQPDGRTSEEASREHLARAAGGETHPFEWVAQTARGQPLALRIQLAPLEISGRRLVRGSLTDIRGQKGVESDRDRFRGVVDATSDFVLMSDPEGKILYANPSVRAALGIPAEEDLRGRSIGQLHPVAKAEEITGRAFKDAVEHGVWEGETEFLARDGTLIPTSQVWAAHTDEDGRLAYLSSIARDVRERRGLELQALHAQKLDSLGLMASGVAHDFNNVLVAILGNLSLLANHAPDLNPEASESLEAAESAAGRASELAREMLAYSGKAEVSTQAVCLDTVVQETTGLLAATISKKIKLEFDFGEGIACASGDPTQVRQVIMNIVLNAAESMGAAPGVITIRTFERMPEGMEMSHSFMREAELESPCICCEVSDGGSGIAEETLARIFDPFFSTKRSGRGLGLSAALGILKSHRGAVKVSSRPGGGTTFLIALPAAGPGPAVAPQTSITELGTWQGAGRVLVADDEASIRKVVQRVLSRRGFEVIQVADGPAALDLIAKEGHSLAAVILDMMMPGLDGAEVLTEIRRTDPSLPVILMSGYPQQAASPEATMFIPKPFSAGRLLGAVRAVLEKTDTP